MKDLFIVHILKWFISVVLLTCGKRSLLLQCWLSWYVRGIKQNVDDFEAAEGTWHHVLVVTFEFCSVIWMVLSLALLLFCWMSFTVLLTWQTKIYLFSYSWYQNIVHLFLINIHPNDFVLPNTSLVIVYKVYLSLRPIINKLLLINFFM